MNESMDTTASKNPSENGSIRASARIGKTPSSTPASRTRWMFSEALNHRSVAQTWTPNSRRRKTEDRARPQPRSSTRMPGRRSSASVSHSVSHRGLAPPLTPASTHSGWYTEARGNRSEINRSSTVMRASWLNDDSTESHLSKSHRLSAQDQLQDRAHRAVATHEIQPVT